MRKYGSPEKVLRDKEEEQERKTAAKNFTEEDRKALARENEDLHEDPKKDDE